MFVDSIKLTSKAGLEKVLHEIDYRVELEDWFMIYNFSSPRYSYNLIGDLPALFTTKNESIRYGGAVKENKFYVYRKRRNRLQNTCCPVLDGSVVKSESGSEVIAKIVPNPMTVWPIAFVWLSLVLIFPIALYSESQTALGLTHLNREGSQLAIIFVSWMIGWPVVFWLIDRSFKNDRVLLCKFIEDVAAVE